MRLQPDLLVQSHLQSVSATIIALVFYGLHFPLVLAASAPSGLPTIPSTGRRQHDADHTFAALTLFLLPTLPP
ncbi:hypothetical protein E6H29_04020 [Candidatus Bathyarchaeota archaeon]|nr:MAG: hypothetical protein E6H29_04020 [Candidatus Bathyarchaeota archaeon]